MYDFNGIYTFSNSFNASINSSVAAFISGALAIAPLIAIPFTPASINGYTSAGVKPPLATTGMFISFCFMSAHILRYPSTPRTGARFFFVSVNRNGHTP